MESNVPSPVMNWNSPNLPDAWRKFQQHVELMFSGPLKSRSESEKVSYLLIWVGETGRDIFSTFNNITEENKNLLKTYYDSYENYVTPKSNTVFARFKFHTRVQNQTDTFDSFVTDLKLLVKDCGYHDPDEMVRDRIVFGTSSPVIREKLINIGSDLTLNKAIETAHAFELSQSQLRTMSGESGVSQIHTVKSTSGMYYKDCYFCGRDHGKGQCPAYGSVCSKCNVRNHWAKQCEIASQHLRKRRPRDHKRSNSRSRRPRSRSVKDKSKSQTVHQMECGQESEEDLCIHSISSTSKNRLQVKLKITNTNTSMLVQVDTGAGVNLLPIRCFKQLFPSAILPSGKVNPNSEILTPKPLTTLSAYGGQDICQFGTVNLSCDIEQETYNVQFYVCDSNGPIILGLKDSCRMKLININDKVQQLSISVVTKTISPESCSTHIKSKSELMTQYPIVFKGIGKFPGEAKLQLKDDAAPVVQAPRRCAIHLKKEIQTALDEMEQLGVISKIPTGQPTEWLSNLVYARKSNGKLRICLDPRDLNASIKRTYHRAHTLEEITHKLAGACVFSKLDAKNGYWSIVLDEQSSLLTAFSAPGQRYKFNRLPFGINVSQDLFQEAMDNITRGLEGVISIADDICIFGKDEKEHDANLHVFMEKAKNNGLVLNPDKCSIKVPEIHFFGMVYNENGVRPDKERVKEIIDLPPPDTKQELQSLLGMIQYLSPFIPHLSDQTAPLRDLLKKDTIFAWTSTHDQIFRRLKDIIAESTTLHYFNPAFETKIQVDASS